ncbi:MAG: hypothetical protein HUU57_01600, partial [Bdellovibrio sp.]|nr:hypothetical protein [Bdellovibrio sp.]
MNPLSKYLVIALALISFHAKAQESAPQEAPYIQEDNEFEDLPVPAEPEAVNLNDSQIMGAEGVDDIFKEETTVPVAEEPAVIPADPVAPVYRPARPSVGRSTSDPKKGGVKYIEHPLAAKGLIAITKDGSYIYKTKDSGKFNNTGSFRFGLMDPPKISAADGTSFEMMYSKGQQPVFMFDYEWQPFTGFGKLGVQAGFGVLLANGSGRFVTPPADGKTPKEKYTFAAIPLNVGLVYRLEWMSRQWLAPYVAGGGTYMGVAEFRDDGKSPSLVGTPG